MPVQLTRRKFITASPGLLLFPGIVAMAQTPATAMQEPIYPQFPSQNPSRVKEMVGASHGNIARVRELLADSPALAKATYDWGFGDWETALGAASHVGNREIAALLMDNGARPDMFTFAMLGQLEVVKAYITANPGIQRTHGPHGITLLQHARKGGEKSSAVVAYLESIGDADVGYTSLPLTEEEKKMYMGEYSFGSEPSNRIKISVDKNGTPGIMRQPDGVNRVLYYQGNNEFHPAGAPAVRIRFDVKDGKAANLTIIDGKTMLTATRV